MKSFRCRAGGVLAAVGMGAATLGTTLDSPGSTGRVPSAMEGPYLSEFMASNTRTLKDDLGQFPDWIEIHNPSGSSFDMGGWWLTDSRSNLTKWRLPATNIAAGEFLVVFASGLNRRVPGNPLHTSFQLAAEGEYLGLVRPDGVTVVSEFSPAYPRQVPDVSFGTAQVAVGEAWEMGPSGVYFTQPTPGAPNAAGTSQLGPIIGAVQHSPAVPLDGEDMGVTARVRPAFQPVAKVTLRYRIMFDGEVAVPMLDDGRHGDGLAGDGVYGATIDESRSGPGQMVRYFVTAMDAAGTASRWPLFTHPTGTEEYLGTVVEPARVSSRLPVFHLFVVPGQMAGIDTETGGRVAFFHDGEFYDNVYMEVRGNTSAGLRKKSHRIEFNRGHDLRHVGPGGRTRRSSLLAEYLDPAYLRQHLSFWFLDRIGVPAPFNYPVRVQLNGEFYQLAFHSDVLGREQVERLGYDPRGALYKAVGNLTPNFSSTGGFQKLEPEGDSSRADYLQLAQGINEASTTDVRRRTVFDLLDVPQIINYMAGARWCGENDDVWANMSLYRDTLGDGLWRCIPFDMNASWGQLHGGGNTLEATNDFSKSHPLYGGSSTGANFNRLYDVVVQLPETRQMLLRRERSIMDLLVQPPETQVEARILESYIGTMRDLIATEAALDRAKWGNSPWTPGKSFVAGIDELLHQFVGPRRRHWYVTHSIANTSRPVGITAASNAGIPLPQPLDASLSIAEVEFNPATGNQAEEYVALRNNSPLALDISGWSLGGGVSFTFRPGTVVPSHSVLYVSPDVRQFRARASGPRGGQGLFVVGPYSGQLSARGETLTLDNHRGSRVAATSYAGAPSPAQNHLRITEIMFHPADFPGNPAPADDFEYLELRNISTDVSLDLTGVSFVTGIGFDFTGSPLSSLPPGARVLVVANRSAFDARYGTGLPVAGEYVGRLDNGGERLRLVDAASEEILDFEFKDGWHPTTDGGGFSLEVVNEAAEPDAWGQRSQWRPSLKRDGTPGGSWDSPPPLGPPFFVVQPVSQSVVPGGPLVLSFAVDPAAALPVEVQVWRNGTPYLPGAGASHTVYSHDYFLALDGADTAPPWTRYSFVVANVAAPWGIESAPATIDYVADADGDGLADMWERSAWGNLGAEPDEDFDGDGLTNWGEYVAGTDPRAAGSRLTIDGISPPPGANIEFLAISNRTHTVQFTDDLGNPSWSTLADLPAHATNRVARVTDPGSRPHRAYRVVTPCLRAKSPASLRAGSIGRLGPL